MKRTKLFSALVALMAMGVVACNPVVNPSSSEPASTPSSDPAPSSDPSSEASSESSSEAPSPVVCSFTWSSADIKAGLTNQSQTEVDFGDDVKGYKSAGIEITLTYNATEAKTTKLALLLSVKAGNNTSATFWKSGENEKTRIVVNDNQITPPETDFNMESKGLTERHATAKDGGSTLTVPVWVEICDISLNAGNNTIVISNHSSNYSFFFCGAGLE